MPLSVSGSRRVYVAVSCLSCLSSGATKKDSSAPRPVTVVLSGRRRAVVPCCRAPARCRRGVARSCSLHSKFFLGVSPANCQKKILVPPSSGRVAAPGCPGGCPVPSRLRLSRRVVGCPVRSSSAVRCPGVASGSRCRVCRPGAVPCGVPAAVGVAVVSSSRRGRPVPRGCPVAVVSSSRCGAVSNSPRRIVAGSSSPGRPVPRCRGRPRDRWKRTNVRSRTNVRLPALCYRPVTYRPVMLSLYTLWGIGHV